MFYGRTRRQFTDEFVRESVGLRAGGGRPSSQIADALGIAPSRPRAWRNRGDAVHAGSPRRSHTQAIPHDGADLAAGSHPRRGNERPRMAREISKNQRGRRLRLGQRNGSDRRRTAPPRHAAQHSNAPAFNERRALALFGVDLTQIHGLGPSLATLLLPSVRI